MKKLLLIIFGLLTFVAQAQDVDVDVDMEMETENVWEIKANALYLVLGIAEVSLERSLNNNSAIGITGSLPFDDSVKENIEYLVTPYYRYYFGAGQTEGFFLEGFGMLNSIETEIFDFDLEDDEDFTTDFALGIGLGGKWVTSGGFVGEVNFGIGRNLFNTDEHDYEVIAKGAITVGLRF
ncbi:MAG: DUF3575 domain-containing protein [Flavobacteriaceae bacterium]|nr:DUF3575 domain-containing protein [Flavobacteriaceae bacterium]